MKGHDFFKTLDFFSNCTLSQDFLRFFNRPFGSFVLLIPIFVLGCYADVAIEINITNQKLEYIQVQCSDKLVTSDFKSKPIKPGSSLTYNCFIPYGEKYFGKISKAIGKIDVFDIEGNVIKTIEGETNIENNVTQRAYDPKSFDFIYDLVIM